MYNFNKKIMNVENLGVQEMSAIQIITTDGGGFWNDVQEAHDEYLAAVGVFWANVAEGFSEGAKAVVEASN
jgi:hypothetical protein